MNVLATYFEIPVTDLERAITFYTAVFGGVMERTQIDGNEMALFPLPDESSGISGALAKGDSYAPGTQGIRLYIRAASIDETLKKVQQAGGQILYPKTSIGDLGWVAEFRDSEGNCLALSEPLGE